MASLTDFEELIALIHNPLMKDYMREAMSCYHSGAYRGCIVMSYIALFDDLVDKLKAIKDVNSDAKSIYTEVEKRRNSQDVFESYLLTQIASKQLISDLDNSTVDLIRDRRNKAAHPSGHHPSAEEARYIFSEVIDKFLSKEALGTKHVVDEIISQFHKTKFFISTSISDTEDTVRYEIEKIHPEAYPYLVVQLLKTYRESSDIIKHNASFFLDGLACLDDDLINSELAKRVLNPTLGNDELSKKCLSIISANPKLINLIDDIPRARFKSLLSDKIEEMDANSVSTKLVFPSVIMKRILDKLGFEYVDHEFHDHIKSLIEKIPFREGIVNLVASQSVDLKTHYFNILCNKAGSYTFSVANNFIDRFYDVEAAAVEILSGSQCLALVVEIISAARHGAWRSSEVVEAKFTPYSLLKGKVMGYLSDCDEESALEVIQNHIGGITLGEFKNRYLITTEQEQAS
ncbi:hypothetical protein HOP60_02860 [Halomonas daqingensis]|uniref:Uncharacterized protein n=1 Tax=Billgrantia desiderata TaxID=52021 RepID=A0ABS9B0W3_9GAMM|nr:hypothetical protein [Halomonas desiderata]MCE8041091.1 hypothetical protein [Halomonas desiderata]MCE8045666.1 hypothetical protein [Halomonas desiderata]